MSAPRRFRTTRKFIAPRCTTTAPPDALAAMGRDRRVIRGINETDASYALRLTRWLDDRRRAGNPYMLMQKLAEYTGAGPAFRTVDARGNWFSRAADGTESALLKQENWDWDGSEIGDRWSRFWVVVYPNGLWTDGPTWGSFTWGEPNLTLGTTATPEHVVTLRHIVNDWKYGGTKCVSIIIALDDASFDPTAPDPDGSWGRWAKYSGDTVVESRLNTARFVERV